MSSNFAPAVKQITLAVVLLLGGLPSTLLAQTPVAYYPFDGDTNDYSGNDLHGTKTDAVLYVPDCNGVPDSAVEFTHSSDARIALGNHTEFNALGNEFTITFWTKVAEDDGGIIIDHDVIGTVPSWIVMVETGDALEEHRGKLRIQISDYSDNHKVRGDVRVDDGTWHHVAVRREQANGGNVWFFVDGVAAGFATGYPQDLGNVNTDTNLGPYDIPEWVDGIVGRLDELRFYDRLLSDEEISSLASQCPGGEPIPAVSEWGVVLMALLTLTAGTLVYMKRKPTAA